MDEPRWLDDREQRAWRGFLDVHARLLAELGRRMQEDSGLSMADFDVLVALTDRAGVRLRVRELADAVGWEKSRLSHQLSRMQRRGLVEREECPDDARGAFVVLTDDGRRAIERAAPPHVEAVRQFVFDGLDAAQVDALTRIAETVLGRIDPVRSPGASPATPSRR